MNERVNKVIAEHQLLVTRLETMGDEVNMVAELVSKVLLCDGKVLLCGNGGSAADAQHIAGELVGRFLKERRALPAVALHTDTSVMTAIGNDYSFDEVFARQVEALGRAGDILIAISTSGNSPNVVRAAQVAREKEVRVVGMTGEDGGELKQLCDACLCVPSRNPPRIQESHILLGHIICQLVEEAICCDKP